MKKDLLTVVIAAVAGFALAYFVTNMIYPSIDGTSVKTLSSVVSSSISQPSDDIFNFRSINPTVEVYVGQCKEYNANGDCVESYTGTETEESENTEDEGAEANDSSAEDAASGNSN